MLLPTYLSAEYADRAKEVGSAKCTSNEYSGGFEFMVPSGGLIIFSKDTRAKFSLSSWASICMSCGRWMPLGLFWSVLVVHWWVKLALCTLHLLLSWATKIKVIAHALVFRVTIQLSWDLDATSQRPPVLHQRRQNDADSCTCEGHFIFCQSRATRVVDAVQRRTDDVIAWADVASDCSFLS